MAIHVRNHWILLLLLLFGIKNINTTNHTNSERYSIYEMRKKEESVLVFDSIMCFQCKCINGRNTGISRCSTFLCEKLNKWRVKKKVNIEAHFYANPKAVWTWAVQTTNCVASLVLYITIRAIVLFSLSVISLLLHAFWRNWLMSIAFSFSFFLNWIIPLNEAQFV